MAANDLLGILFEQHKYAAGIDFEVRAPFEGLLELLDAPNHGVEHLGRLSMELVKAPADYDYPELGDTLTMEFTRMGRELEIDNQVITPTTSWYRDNNRKDVFSGGGALIVPDSLVQAPGVIPSHDGRTLAVPSEANFRAYNSYNSRIARGKEGLIRGYVSLLLFEVKFESERT